MHISLQRIAADIQMCREQKLDLNDGIYLSPDQKNPYLVYAMIVGPSDTPYENGYYFFTIKFPSNYPFSPPVVNLVTQGNNVRFNPNFYTNGKVCVSILNTWKGPQWTSCLNLKAVLISLQTLMNDNPLVNEPGWETNVDRMHHKVYKQIVTSENIRTAIIAMMLYPPKLFDVFLPFMRELFIANFSAIDAHVAKLAIVPRKEFNCSVYNMKVKYNYAELRSILHTIRKKFTADEIYIDYTKDSESNKAEKKKRVPDQSAKQFYAEHGPEATLEYNNVLFSAYPDARNYYRWKKVSAC